VRRKRVAADLPIGRGEPPLPRKDMPLGRRQLGGGINARWQPHTDRMAAFNPRAASGGTHRHGPQMQPRRTR
jgi:hypothetical protein